MFDRKGTVKKTGACEECRLHPSMNLTRTVVRELLASHAQVWDALPYLQNHITNHGDLLSHEEFDEIAENIWVHVSAYLAPTCRIEAPAIICGGAKICHYAHVEGSVIGAFATVGEMSHVKNSIMFRSTCIENGATVENSIIMQGSRIGKNARLDYVILDKDVTVMDGTVLCGTPEHPVIIPKGATV